MINTKKELIAYVIAYGKKYCPRRIAICDQHNCRKCGENLNLIGLYCDVCIKAVKKDTKYKEQVRAFTKKLVNKGLIHKTACEVCCNKNTECHHEDYDYPDKVRWFCRKHHREHHTFLHFSKDKKCHAAPTVEK